MIAHRENQEKEFSLVDSLDPKITHYIQTHYNIIIDSIDIIK